MRAKEILKDEVEGKAKVAPSEATPPFVTKLDQLARAADNDAGLDITDMSDEEIRRVLSKARA